MYGEFGKNKIQDIIKIIKENFLFKLFNTIKELITHGMKAKNKFQFKNKKTLVSVIKYRAIDMDRQNNDIAIKSTVMFSLPRFLSLLIMMDGLLMINIEMFKHKITALNFLQKHKTVISQSTLMLA